MIISGAEIAKAVALYKPWEPKVIPFPPPGSKFMRRQTLRWARPAYDRLPPLRDTLVFELRGRIVAGRYYVPASAIVEKIIGRLVIDRIAV